MQFEMGRRFELKRCINIQLETMDTLRNYLRNSWVFGYDSNTKVQKYQFMISDQLRTKKRNKNNNNNLNNL